MADHILSMSNISKNFAGVHALRGVSFDLYPGEVHALLGENGAGKSTLIKIITGVHQPDGGEITLNGRQIQLANPLESRRLGIAAIYQEPSLFPDLDIAENIFVGRQPTRAGGQVAWSDMYREASKLLDSLGVHLEPKTKARHLSVAQQQMVEIARALSVQAKILIMDEPTSVLTPQEVEILFQTLRKLRAEGVAVFHLMRSIGTSFFVAISVAD